MNENIVKRVKIIWAGGLVCVTGVVLIGSGLPAAAVTALAYVGTSVLAVVAYILNLLMGEAPVAFRLLLILLFLVGLVVEVYGIVSMFG